MNQVELLTMMLGLIQGYLILINKRSNWIAYCLQMIVLFAFSVSVKLYGDAFNSVLYLAYGLVGYLQWGNPESKIRVIKVKERFTYLAVLVISILISYLVLSNTDDPFPLLDSITTMSSLIATYYMVKRVLETWYIWFIVDILYCIQYFLLSERAWFLITLNFIWVFMAIVSYLNWRNIMRSYYD